MGLNSEYADRIVLDIETVASPDAAQYLDPVEAPSNYKDPVKIAAYCQEKFAERVEKAGLEADLCEVVAIGIGSPTRDAIVVRTRTDFNERELLRWAWLEIGQRAVVGFSSLAFDLPVLIRRSQLLDVAYPDLNLDRYRSPHVDLLEKLSFNGKLTMRSLAFYCRRFGIPCEDTTTGAEIAAMVAAQNWIGVANHCHADVQKTAELARRLGWLHTPVEADLVA